MQVSVVIYILIFTVLHMVSLCKVRRIWLIW